MSPSMSPPSSNWNHPGPCSWNHREYLHSPPSCHSPPTGDYVPPTGTHIQPYNAADCSDIIGSFQQSDPPPDVSQVTQSESAAHHVCELPQNYLECTSLSPHSPLPPPHVLPTPPTLCDGGPMLVYSTSPTLCPPTAALDLSSMATAEEGANTYTLQHSTERVCPSPVPSEPQDEIMSGFVDKVAVQDSSSTYEGPGGTSGASLTSTQTCSSDYIAMHTEH